ncbi:MAG: two-component regulator propeller domain-containing protein [Bacteroidia bacterium]
MPSFFRPASSPFLVLCLVSYVLILTQPQATAQQYHFKNYSVQDGIAQSQVYSIFEDSRGFLWMGTRGGGLSRYDGLNFKTYTIQDGLADNFVSCIAEDAGHNLLIGTNQGLSIYDGKRFFNFNLQDGNGVVYVQAIAGGKWIGTNRGLYCMHEGVPVKVSKCPRENILSLLITPDGNLWAGTNGNGALCLPGCDTSVAPLPYSTGKGLGKTQVYALCSDRNHKLIASTNGAGIYQLNGDYFNHWIVNNPLNKKQIFGMLPDSKGNLWFATPTDGVCKWNGADSSFTFLGENEGLANNHVRCMLEDSRGDFWFGTSGGGVSKYSGQAFVHYSKSNGLSGNFVYSVYRDSHDRLWIGSGDKGVCMYDGKSFTPYSEKEGFHNYKVKVITEDKDSLLWFGTEGQGVFIFDENNFIPVPELKGKFIRDIIRDQQQNMWIATAGAGIYKLSPGAGKNRFEVIHIRGRDLPSDRINALAEDKQGRIWFATEASGAGCLQGDTLSKLFLAKDGLASNTIRSLLFDTNGNLWFGTPGSGISMLHMKDEVTIDSYGTDKGLHSGTIYLLSADQQGNVFAGSETGLDKLKLDAESHVVDITHFGLSEGFTGIETCQNAVYRDKQGWMWFGTISGLTGYNPSNKIKNTAPPRVRITGVSLFYKALEQTPYASCIGAWGNIDSALLLPHDQNLLTFDFSAINLSAPENVLFQWKLEGFDNAWSPPSIHRDATYSNLAPGSYTFRIKACNEDGVWSKDPAIVHFTILKPFWLKTWFLVSCSCLLLLLLWLLFRWRVQRIKVKARIAQEKTETEKTLIELEQKALRLQMNPHFIFNALNSIQSQITENNEQTARHYLGKFSRLMRMILENSQQTEISLEDEIKTLENYLALEKFSSGDQFDYEINVLSADPQEIHLPPMMIQPFVENAIIHGLKHLSHRGHIRIEFSVVNNHLECRIIDNGIGRKKAAENTAQQESHHKSTALIVTQERLDRMEGSTSKSLEILDREDENGLPMGTTVVLRIPVK